MSWPIRHIGTVIHSSQYGLSLPTHDDGNIPMVGMKDIQNGRVRVDPEVRVKLTDDEAIPYLLKDGDILLNRTNSPDLVGKAGIYRGEGKAVFASYLVRLNLDREHVDPDFVIQILASEGGQRHIRQLATRAISQANLNPTTFKNYFQLPLPPLVEQVGIRDVLMAWDIAIQKTEQLAAAKERHYTGMVYSLIALRARSEGWRQISLRDIADRVQRQGDGDDYPLLTISSASGFIRQEDRYSRYMAGESAKTYTLLRAGEFSYNKGNSKRYEFGCVFQLLGHEAALVPSVYVSFRLRESVCTAYLRHLFAADYLKPQLRALVKTGVRNNGLLNIRPDEFMGTTVPLPSLEEQTQIASALDAASAELDLLRRQLVALRAQKRGLMQKLLTGQWRLRISENTGGTTCA